MARQTLRVGINCHKYVLVLVDKCTTNSFVYGMLCTSGADIVEALWKFFIDTGGLPCTIQCDLDSHFIGRKEISLLQSHGCYVQAAPPNHQDHNGLVERHCELLTNMARAFLAESRLPKQFWYWAICEAY